jgi:hypothetical protein
MYFLLQEFAMTIETVTKNLDAVQFDVSYEGRPIPARITAAALHRLAVGELAPPGAPLRAPQLLATFRDHQDIIQETALTMVAQGDPQIELTAAYFN